MAFQSVGKTRQSFIAAISRPVLFLIPLVFILPRFLQVDGIWLAFPISDGLTFILTVIFIIPKVREMRNASQSGMPPGIRST